jgi:predicted regulator of Ras-like GTPase activity (Roadblock/LC7/MglB family)
MGRDKLRRLEERSVILSGIVDTDGLYVHSSFPYSADALAAAPTTTISVIDLAFMRPLPA